MVLVSSSRFVVVIDGFWWFLKVFGGSVAVFGGSWWCLVVLGGSLQ